MLSTISNNIKNEVISLYQAHNIDFEINKYDRLIDTTVKYIINSNISNDGLCLYYAILLYPVNNIYFHNFDYQHIRNILEKVGLPNYINHESIINLYKDKNSILYQIIEVDETSPPAMMEMSVSLRQNKGMPLYNRHVPYIKDRNQLKSICSNTGNYRTFIEYIYHVGLHLFENIKTKEKYLTDLLKVNKEAMIDLCLVYGEKESLTIEDIEDWINKNSK